MTSDPVVLPPIDLGQAVTLEGSTHQGKKVPGKRALRYLSDPFCHYFDPFSAHSGERYLSPQEFSLEAVGTHADNREWPSSAGVYLQLAPDPIRRNYGLMTADGTIERGSITAEGIKHGLYQLFYGLTGCGLFTHEETTEITQSSMLKESGFFFHGIPCGGFTISDENYVITCWGSYELIVPQSLQENSLFINLDELYEFFMGEPRRSRGKRKRHKPKKTASPKQETPPAMLAVNPEAIVVHYEGLSCDLASGVRQSITLSPESSAVLIERGPEESWTEACSRTHAQMQRVFAAQIKALHEAQQAAVPQGIKPQELLAVQAAYRDLLGEQPWPEPYWREEWHNLPPDELDTELAAVSAQALLATRQDDALIFGCQQGGFAGLNLGILPQVAAGTYGLGLMVSSGEHLKELCLNKLRSEAETRWAYYGLSPQGKLVTELNPGDYPLPLYPESEPVLRLDAGLSDLQHSFKWQALGPSEVTSVLGERLAQVEYGPLGLMHGVYNFFYERDGRSELGHAQLGLLTSHFSYRLYQNYKAGFPAAILTMERASCEFDGPYQVICDLDELFARGLHRQLLASMVCYSSRGREVRSFLAPYNPGSFVRERGVYVKGKPQPKEKAQRAKIPF